MEINLVEISKIRVKGLITDNKLTQKEFCNLCNINPSKLTNFLRHDKMLDRDEFITISRVFNTTVTYLFGLNDNIGNGKLIKE